MTDEKAGLIAAIIAFAVMGVFLVGASEIIGGFIPENSRLLPYLFAIPFGLAGLWVGSTIFDAAKNMLLKIGQDQE